MKWGAYYRQSKKLKYRGNRRKTTGSHTEKQWLELCSFFNGVCPRCKKECEEFTKDHIIPLTRGGTNGIENLQPLCLRCNVQKSNLYTIDYRTEEAKKWLRENNYGGS